MRTRRGSLEGVVIVDPDVHGDERGFFAESFSRRRYAEAGIAADFVQDNVSRSERNVLRGMHYQIRHPQGHMVFVSRGEIFDVGLDLRRGSPTFGEWMGVALSAGTLRQVYWPPGLAHGFCVLSDDAIVNYKCTAYYAAGDEGGVAWNDPDVGIEWPIDEPLIAPRDAAFPRLHDVSVDCLPQLEANAA